MKYPTIKTDNYILITSDEEIKLQDWCILFDSVGNLFYDIPQQYTDSKNQHINKYLRKVIAHLPLNNSPILEGVTLLPPLPNEEDFDKKLLTEEYEQALKRGGSEYAGGYCEGLFDGFEKAKEKYNITSDKILDLYIEETGYGMDMWSKEENATMLVIAKIIDSLSQPKLPVGFKCEMVEFEVDMGLGEECIEYGNYPKIINGVIQGEWIF